MTTESEQAKTELPISLKEKLFSLRDALEKNNPGYATILQEIKNTTLQNPDYVYALSDEEFQTIVAGASRYSGVVIQTSEKKKGEKKMSAEQGKLLSADSV